MNQIAAQPQAQPSASKEWRGGWTLVLASLTGIMVSALPTSSIGVLMEPLEREFGWARAEISSGPGLVSIIAMALATLVGLAIDRFGARPIALTAAGLMLSAIALMSTVSDSLWHWWAIWGLAGVASAAMPAAWLAPITARFSASRGLAMAVALCGSGITNSLAPIVTHYLVENHGWRVAYLGVAAIWALFALPIIVAFFWSGSRSGGASAKTATASGDLPGLSVREGLSSRAFYQIGIAAFLSTGAGVGIILNLFPVLVSTGISRGDAAWVAGLMGVSTIVGRLCGGWLLDRVEAKVIAALSAFLAIAMPVCLLLAPGSITVAALGVATYGLVGGAKIPAIAYLTSRHLGQKAFGTLYGTINASIALSVAISPVAANLIYDAAKSYNMAMWAAVPALVVAAILYVTLGRYPDFSRKDAAAA